MDEWCGLKQGELSTPSDLELLRNHWECLLGKKDTTLDVLAELETTMTEGASMAETAEFTPVEHSTTLLDSQALLVLESTSIEVMVVLSRFD